MNSRINQSSSVHFSHVRVYAPLA